MSKNMQRFGNTLTNRMNRTAQGAFRTTMELGMINANLSLTPDSLQDAIPKGDYMVNLMLTGSRSTISVMIDGNEHSHALPSAFRSPQAGDRVLVAWCGNEAVVIAIVGSSAVMLFSDGGSSTGGGSSGSGGTGSGTTGQSGKDGFSPTVLVTPITGGNRVTITDVNGPKTFDVMDGKNPEKGTDYFTAAEVEAIVQDVVKRVTALFEDKFYTKEQIDTRFAEEVITGEEVRSLLEEVFDNK